MSDDEVKARNEREICERFLNEMGQAERLITLESRLPPEPDILCYFQNSKVIAYEVVEICSPEIAIVRGEDLRNNTCTYVRTSDTSVDAISAKCLKRYTTEHPIELIAYKNGRSVSPDDFIVSRFNALVAPSQSLFRKIWLLGKRPHLLYSK